MKKLTITILILLTLVVGSSLAASCTTVDSTKTATVTNTIAASVPGVTTTTATVTATVTPPPGTTTFPPPATTSTISPTVTAGELAASGGTLYNKTCTYPECHAKFGEGGKDEFTAAKLSSFNNAERVFNLISSIMHLNIGDYEEDAPSLDDYMQILAYILVQNDIVQSNDLFGRSNLPDISIMAPVNPTVTTTFPPPATTSTISPTVTAGELAASGGTLYNKTCTYPECHAKFGEGGKDEFTAAKLSSFNNAERVFNLISSIMHLNIGDYEEDAPSLDDYMQILAYILVQNDIVQSNDLFGRSNLPDISIMAPVNPTVTTTAGELAFLGGNVYSGSCVLDYCHEPWDLDGKAEFVATSWEYFGDAQGYFDFVQRFMPGENPGSLSDELYLQVIALILLETGKVQSTDLFGIGNLADIRLD